MLQHCFCLELRSKVGSDAAYCDDYYHLGGDYVCRDDALTEHDCADRADRHADCLRKANTRFPKKVKQHKKKKHLKRRGEGDRCARAGDADEKISRNELLMVGNERDIKRREAHCDKKGEKAQKPLETSKIEILIIVVI